MKEVVVKIVMFSVDSIRRVVKRWGMFMWNCDFSRWKVRFDEVFVEFVVNLVIIVVISVSLLLILRLVMK